MEILVALAIVFLFFADREQPRIKRCAQLYDS